MLAIHLLKSYDRNRNAGVTECGEPFHLHPQSIGRGHVEGEFESTRRIGGLRAVDENRFGQAVAARWEKDCAKCRKVWEHMYD